MTFTTGSNATMTAMAPESVQYRFTGQRLETWLYRRGCDQRTINRIAHDRKWQYGSFRPSDRAALLTDASPDLTEIAAD